MSNIYLKDIIEEKNHRETFSIRYPGFKKICHHASFGERHLADIIES